MFENNNCSNCNQEESSEYLRYEISNGWSCGLCEHYFGENKNYDINLIDIKIHDIVQELHNELKIYICNVSYGELLVYNIENLCLQNENYSTDFIMEQIYKITKSN